jgi:hypothetical protein
VDYDFASFGFSLTFFAAGSICSWTVNGYPWSKGDDALLMTMDTRLNEATKQVQDRVKTSKLQKRILELLNFDTKYAQGG